MRRRNEESQSKKKNYILGKRGAQKQRSPPARRSYASQIAGFSLYRRHLFCSVVVGKGNGAISPRAHMVGVCPFWGWGREWFLPPPFRSRLAPLFSLSELACSFLFPKCLVPLLSTRPGEGLGAPFFFSRVSKPSAQFMETKEKKKKYGPTNQNERSGRGRHSGRGGGPQAFFFKKGPEYALFCVCMKCVLFLFRDRWGREG